MAGGAALPARSRSGAGPQAGTHGRRQLAFSALVLSLPVIGFVLLVARPELDGEWQHHPAHFWLVLAAGALNAVLAYATGAAARRRGDARVLLVSLAFLSAGGFLGLHALATPGVLLPTTNAGFALATPLGLAVASLFAAASSLDLSPGAARWVVRHAWALLWALVAVMVVWGVVSVAAIWPLNDPTAPERASGALVGLAAVGFVLYCVAVVRYLRLPRHVASSLPFAMAAAFTLLAEAEVAVAWGRNWHMSWWEWHLLMLAAFVVVAVAAQQSWREERFVGLYRDDTASGQREVSVVFADLQGFTTFSEAHAPAQVTDMLNTYFTEVIPPVVRRFGGDIDRIVGDAIMATFNTRGDQSDHAERAAGAALAIQSAANAVAEKHPGWPRFRAGVNTGPAAVGVLGAVGGRTFTVIGDAVNVAARLEGQAPVGGVAIGGETLRRLTGATTESLGRLHVKGREEPVDAYRLVALAVGGGVP
ncbi:MAG TPA: adenylate/guanylate cyclase domain-containing protein [Actinomycetales bacterium]|nr:adenylate/guanylate cyclase domain-containing protein [Actinomycetales bacterium]